ncbi:MAG: pyridoxamine 5'-phosphate oxidase [Flavobacteriales bacterium]|mgnify:FL=1|jgi:pyridoxamine 5'-phosphate oxidase|nr:pyridoxamine 5'-phosphate oxidase [Flavobacteriales bacterium]MBT6965893.1 pyridoxamine 5'-phosphate oxidase [Flavobacteriales bacterium]
MDLKNLRLNYKKSAIDFKNLEDNPISFFLKWFDDTLKVNKDEANACVLSTVSVENKPSSRVVLLKSVNEKGFTFFTNYKSDKSLDIQNNPNVSLNFYWPELERQVRITGIAEQISPKDSDEYFKNRPRESQMGAWLSHQSTSIGLYYDFMDTLNKLESTFKGKDIERPLHWGGYCIIPSKIEFWQGRPSRLHDRLLYEFDENVWNKKRLAP